MLVEYADGSIEVRGLSNRPAEAARLGYVGGRQPVRPIRPLPTPTPTPRRAPARTAAAVAADDAARRLLETLLDEHQLAERRRSGRWWVETDRGWLQLGGTPHDLRFRPTDDPGREWSLCVVPADPSLPADDVWSTLLLTATNLPDTFFRVAHRAPAPMPTPAPAHPIDRSAPPTSPRAPHPARPNRGSSRAGPAPS